MARGYRSEHNDAYYFKPEKFNDYLTIGELAEVVGRSRRWLIRLEERGSIPKAKRHRIGAMHVRLYSPQAVEELKEFFEAQRPGRKKAEKS